MVFEVHQEEHIDAPQALWWKGQGDALKWRVQIAGNVGTKTLHLMASQVLSATGAQERSASEALAPILETISALAIGGSIVQHCACTRTIDNPASAGTGTV